MIHRKLGLSGTTVAFDINSTCLSFLTGFFCMGNLIAQGLYRHVLLVSSDIASMGLNPKDAKTVSLFGDGAAACVLGKGKTGGIIASHFETRCELRTIAFDLLDKAMEKRTKPKDRKTSLQVAFGKNLRKNVLVRICHRKN